MKQSKNEAKKSKKQKAKTKQKKSNFKAKKEQKKSKKVSFFFTSSSYRDGVFDLVTRDS
jgi:hypothetical protein